MYGGVIMQTDSTAWKQRFISSTLVIMRYSTSFQGRYTCVANNGFRVKRQTFRLRGLFRPITNYITWFVICYLNSSIFIISLSSFYLYLVQ